MTRRLAYLAMLCLVLAPAALATTIFTLNIDGCTGGCGPGPYGEVLLDQTDTGKVDVVVNLFSPNAFVSTGGPHHALAWNIAGDKIINIDLSSTDFVVGPSPTSASPFGAFEYSIDCSETGCGNGASRPNPGPLKFTVTGDNLLVTDFVPNAGGFYFTADIIGPSGLTGNVACNCAGDPAPAPEPSTVLLAGSALAGIACWLRRKRAVA